MGRRVRTPWLDDEPKRIIGEGEFQRLADLLRSVPGPTPWYADDNPLIDGPDGSMLIWKKDTNRTILVRDGSDRPIYLALGLYCYVWQLDDCTLLIFHSRRTKSEVLPAHFHILDCSFWNPLNLGAEWNPDRQIDRDECPVAFNGPQQIVEMPIDFEPGVHRLRFPEVMKSHEELLVITATGEHRLRMCVLKPRSDRVEVHSLDWFDDGDFDHGYDWITRIVRDPTDGNIIGEGIRILPFIMKPNGEFVDWIAPPKEVW